MVGQEMQSEHAIHHNTHLSIVLEQAIYPILPIIHNSRVAKVDPADTQAIEASIHGSKRYAARPFPFDLALADGRSACEACRKVVTKVAVT